MASAIFLCHQGSLLRWRSFPAPLLSDTDLVWVSPARPSFAWNTRVCSPSASMCVVQDGSSEPVVVVVVVLVAVVVLPVVSSPSSLECVLDSDHGQPTTLLRSEG